MGDLDGCVAVAEYMLEGEGGPADPASARQLLDAACRHELVDACFMIGTLYRDGEHVEADTRRALTYFTVACGAGAAESCMAAAALRTAE